MNPNQHIPDGSKPIQPTKPRKAFGGKGMLAQAAANIGKKGMGVKVRTMEDDGFREISAAKAGRAVSTSRKRKHPAIATPATETIPMINDNNAGALLDNQQITGGAKSIKPAKARMGFGGKGMLAQVAANIGKTGMGVKASTMEANGLLQVPISDSDSRALASRKRQRLVEASDLIPGTPAFFARQAEMGGKSLLSKALSALEFLKNMKGQAVSLDTLENQLFIGDGMLQSFVKSMQQNPQVTYTPPGKPDFGTEDAWKLGTYAYRAKVAGVVDKNSLLIYLHERTERRGVPVKDLKDGWPDCDRALNELEAENKILVKRTKKGVAKNIWQDVSSPRREIDPELVAKWLKTGPNLPAIDDIARDLKKSGLVAASDEPKIVKPVAKAPRNKSSRRVAKHTNTHLMHLLKDYSHLGNRAV